VKTQSKVLNSLGRTPVFLQNSPKKRPFFLSILGVNSAVTALAIAAEELAPVFTPHVFRWKTGDLPFPASKGRIPISRRLFLISCRVMKAYLVFGGKGGMVPIMDQPWFQNQFRRDGKHQLESAQTEADHGDAEAQFSRGLRFANGAGTAPDYAVAAHWYLRAANQNHTLAQFNLAIMFADGQGVPPDQAKALMWMQKAAQQGDAGAQHNLGVRHRRASSAGLPEDALESNLEAYKWFSLAAAQGYRNSDTEFAGVALGMTREQVIEGNQRAAAFTVLCSNPAPASP
jgi:hypothetical protein